MERYIREMASQYRLSTLELVETVFTAHENAHEGAMVRSLVEEIRTKPTYVPGLELVMVDKNDIPIGYCMFSRFCLQGCSEKGLLILTPVAVKTEFQRQHISKELIEYGFEKAAAMDYKAVIVEGDPQNYRSRGFVTSKDFGIVAHDSVRLPAPECLMAKALVPGGLAGIHGVVRYDDYKALR